MEEGDVLLFNPATEFQVVEEFEFDELVQRPEAIRFFTIGEQTTDFLEKLLPKTGKVSKAILKKTEYEVDTFKNLHTSLLKETETGVDQSVTSRPTKLPWVTYTYNKEALRTKYEWNQKWFPLFKGLQQNYYLLLLDSLPKNSIYFPEGEGAVVYDALINGNKVLGPYPYTKTAYREDGTFRIDTVKRTDTEDKATFTGYSIGVPPLAPPNPLADHPFLGTRTEPLNLESSEPLPVLLPSVEAILQHAVPRTSNPYKDAKPYLKVYDLRLEDIPWSIWKESFPPVELVQEGAPPIEIPLKTSPEDAPAKVLVDAYKTPWYPGLATRRWLSNQLDGGALVSRILLSRVGTQAPIAIPPPVMLPDAHAIEGTSEDCLPSVITEFNDFAMRGVYRSQKCYVCGWAGHGASECPDRKDKPAPSEFKPGGGCLPLSFITREREEAPFAGKQSWVPGTDASILQEYQTYIARYTEKYIDIVSAVPTAEASRGISETREFILELLADDTRTSEDKSVDILAIIQDTEHTLQKNVYKDESDRFLVCSHTIDQLSGSYEKDPTAFLKKWTVKDSGFRVCLSCGESISEVLEHQDEFDESGRVVQFRSKIEKASFGPTEHITFASSLKKLQSSLDPKEPAEDILYLLLSLLQILPEEEYLKPVLDYTRSESGKVNAKIAGKKLTAKQKSDVELALGVFGFNAVVILMQTHRPQLLPRRSFGSKPLVLRGFPRDTADSADAPLIDSLMSVLTNTFEQYPSTFRGASVVLLRTLLNDRKGVRKVIVNSLTKQFVPVFNQKLQESRDMMETVGVSYVLKNAFQPPIVRPSEGVKETRFRCKDVAPPWLIPSTPFSFRQKELTIQVPLRPSTKSQPISAFKPGMIDFVPTTEEVRSRIKTKAPDVPIFKKVMAFENPELLRSILLEWMMVVGSTSTASQDLKEYIRKTRSGVEMAVGDESMLRDYYKGILAELLSKSTDVTVMAAIERSVVSNLSIRSILTKIDESKRTVDTLKAKEREAFKTRMRSMPDAQREITKTLIDRGLAPYLITRDDREMFMLELQREIEDVAPKVGEDVAAADLPDEGLNVDRDVGAQGEVPEAGGVELEADYGDYGDRRARAADGEEYTEATPFDDEVGMGF